MDLSVHQAETQLSRMLDLVEEGEEVVIHRHGKPVARLVAVTPIAAAPFGAMRGEFELPEDWDRALSPAEADAFWHGGW
jgi:prevent-host-death family protein